MSAVGALAPCGRCASPLEPGDLRCAVCALPAPPIATAAAAVDHARVLRCRECNAAIAFSPAAQAPRCAFCGSVMEVEQPVDPVEEARIRVPFAVAREEASAALRTWLASRGWFAPRALADEAVLDSLAPLYWAAWIVDAQVAVTWTADSSAGSGRSAWAPHAGQFQTQCANLVIPASRGLTTSECSQLAGSYDLARAVPLEAARDGVAGEGSPIEGVIESFDAQRSAARALVHDAIECLAAIRAEPYIPGSRFRNVHVSCLVDAQVTERAALPAWVMAYRYRDKAYRAVIHGQRAGVVIGKAPLDATKIAFLILGGCAIVAIIAILWLTRHR